MLSHAIEPESSRINSTLGGMALSPVNNGYWGNDVVAAWADAMASSVVVSATCRREPISFPKKDVPFITSPTQRRYND
ncbi:hypothetical protein D3C72_2290750 [compost metagenome]